MTKNRTEVVFGKKILCLTLTLVLVLFLGLFTVGCGNSQATGEENESLTISVVTKDMYLDTAVKN
ncbi:hypothetical protein N752_27175 [Desulforamulus aquiferis]|nr:hypothetical protein [Desulforamulus aquiferis]RYD02136.1 hypothetical protein N752_27175 [Desulforamulus aquiferis]